MKIYFAGSIRGGRDDKELYLKIINLLKNYGEVLTEHVSDQALTSWGETALTDEQIYERDMAWAREADVVVSEVTAPSLGVGYEIASAENLGKKIICLYRESPNKRLSAMINGNINLIVKHYKTIDEIPGILENFFK